MDSFKGSCHCKKVTFSFISTNILEEIYKCNCTLCMKKSIIMKSIPKNAFVLESSPEFLEEYVWNKKIAKHYFCNQCGVYTHHIRRRDPEQISVNLMCVDDILIPENTAINLIDGSSHD
ncbi:MAG: type I-B CRISPR-associated protein Cas8b1/Cst1 [Gammaproteobacteria bacterium]|mgnify:FL=1|nr:MAG: type I-B CRISPR-associated protein Cas8b1/Cst1 [Gammaproteobacteria bacterium]